jgi:hypothetical protein
MSRWVLILLILVLSWSLLGCSTKDRIVGPAPGKMVLSCQGLEDLGANYVYQGWLVHGDEMLSIGTFTVDAEGALSSSEFEMPEEDLWAAEGLVITIEPADDDDPGPSRTRYLAGDFGVTGAISDDAQLSPEHPQALGDDFSKVFGSYVLETPTTVDQIDDYVNGIWFGIPGAPPHWGVLLSLRLLPEGWQYEGWVVRADSAISTGKFRFVSSADSDGAGPAAGPDAVPEYPGQDFIDPAMSLPGCDVMITIEPEPDNDPKPFTMVVLADSVIVDQGYFHIAGMENRTAETFPAGSASR